MLGNIDTKSISTKLIKSAPIDSMIYNKDGTMRPQFVKICEEVGISQAELAFKAFEDFKAPNVTHNIQVIRYNHYENKRLAKIEALKNIVRERNPQLFSQLKATRSILPASNTKNYTRKDSMQNDVSTRSEDEILKMTQANTSFIAQSIDGNQFGLLSKTWKTNRNITTPIKKDYHRRVGTSINYKNNNDEGSDNSEENVYDEGYDVQATLDEDFKKYLANRTIQRERIKSAYPRVNQLEESYVEKSKQCILTKEDKYNKSIEKLEKNQKKKLKEKKQKAIEKAETIMEIKIQDEKNRKEKLKQLLTKLDLSQNIKDNTLKVKQDRVIKENEGTKAKIDEISVLRNERESWDPRPYLKSLEDGIQKKKQYSEYQLQQRVGTLRKHSVQVSETQKKHQDIYLEYHNDVLNKLMNKYYTHSLPKPKQKKKNPLEDPKSEEYKHEHAMNNKKEKEELYEKELRITFMDKSKRMSDMSQDRDKKIKEFLDVKRELKNLKIDDVKENFSMMLKTKEKFDWDKYENYKAKCKKIQNWRKNRKSMIVNSAIEYLLNHEQENYSKEYSFDESLAV